MLTWVEPGVVAYAARPLRWTKPGRLSAGDHAAVVNWIEEVRREGIASVICLLDDEHLVLYEDLDGEGLLGMYRRHGLQVAHFPMPDSASAATASEGHERKRRLEQLLPNVAETYARLPRAVLVHCSAGADRSPPVAMYLAENGR